MPTCVGAREARNNFATMLGRVHFGQETIIIERFGKPIFGSFLTPTSLE
jgi:antitoxin (DNA-binding transcriptional repressor) of toxin-antitoxin stability system